MRKFQTTKEQTAYEMGLKDAMNADDPLTMDRIRKMTVEEVAERKHEVEAVLAAGGDS